MPGNTSHVYAALTILGILATASLWGRILGTGREHDGRLTLVYFFGLFGALVGAKAGFLFAEGYAYRDDWVALLTGRSITGALLGGYAAVEIGKRVVGYTRVTGDAFALIVPVALVIGRIGCLFAGCCPGVACGEHWWTITDAAGVVRWPAAGVELLFNVLFMAWAVLATRLDWQVGNRFHVYLIAYGLFRFGHEFLRDDQRLVGSFGGYHVIALALAAFGAWRYGTRRRALANA
ncbi:MAG: prolipoprotein diacylglyceryl transferase [Planctomycetota bacterium]|jgi:phosphatidylglycerol:prolipoprotein diacylglycerol transferase